QVRERQAIAAPVMLASAGPAARGGPAGAGRGVPTTSAAGLVSACRPFVGVSQPGGRVAFTRGGGKGGAGGGAGWGVGGLGGLLVVLSISVRTLSVGPSAVAAWLRVAGSGLVQWPVLMRRARVWRAMMRSAGVKVQWPARRMLSWRRRGVVRAWLVSCA